MAARCFAALSMTVLGLSVDEEPSRSFEPSLNIKLLGYGVDTLVLNVHYSDENGQPIKQEFDDKLVQELDYLQAEARGIGTAVATDWAFQDVLFFVEPHSSRCSRYKLE